MDRDTTLTSRQDRSSPSWWRRPVARDGLLAAALLTLCLLVNLPSGVVIGLDPSAEEHQRAIGLWWAATGLIVAAVALRRRWPLPLLVVGTAATAAHFASGAKFTIIDLGLAVLLYTVAMRYRRQLSLGVLAVLVLLVAGWNVVAATSGRPVPGLPDLVPTVAIAPGAQMGSPAARATRGVAENAWTGSLMLGSILIASWATGSSARSRRAYLNELHAHAKDLERQRDQQALLAAADERARISRELHDVVAHGLSVMVLQAQGAQAALDHRPSDTGTALASIISTGRQSLADMRHVLARSEGVQDPWHPQPGLNRLPALVSQVTAAGTPVKLEITGTRAQLPSAVDRSAYRIIQEALTNTMKHAGPGARADVTVRYEETGLDIEIWDNGRGPTIADGGGAGLRGMGERVRLLGGRFTAQPTPTGGFSVRAVLPLPGSTA